MLTESESLLTLHLEMSIFQLGSNIFATSVEKKVFKMVLRKAINSTNYLLWGITSLPHRERGISVQIQLSLVPTQFHLAEIAC